MATDPLSDYNAKRRFDRTPEPAGRVKAPRPAAGGRFVVQEHHATALHWDVRLEHEGTLPSWAVPKGLPRDPSRNHLAVRTEDHPIEYLDFEGHIPEGQYGGGSMHIWDRGTYEVEEWGERKVKVVLHGQRVRGRYAFFATGGRGGRDWMVHRTDPPEGPWTARPDDLEVVALGRAAARRGRLGGRAVVAGAPGAGGRRGWPAGRSHPRPAPAAPPGRGLRVDPGPARRRAGRRRARRAA